MRFGAAFIIAGLSALANTVMADHLTVVEGCDADLFRICGVYYATFFTAFGEYGVNAVDGCRGTPVPGMTEFCMDWGNSRGHFKFSHQGHKRCLKREETTRFTGDGCWGIECWRSEWRERPCTWREFKQVEAVNGTEGAGNWTEGVNYSTPAVAVPIETGAVEGN